MSKTLLTIEETAKYLGVSTRTVRKYIRVGYLQKTIRRGERKHYLSAQEVESFRLDRDEADGETLFSRRTFLELRAEVRRLRAELDVVLRILDTKTEPLRMSPSYAKELFEICALQLRNTAWTPGEVMPWVEVFLRLEEEDLRTIATAAETRKPWSPFLRLCTAMIYSLTNDPAYATSLEMQALHRQLSEGRRRLRVSAFIYAEAYEGADPELGPVGTIPESSIRDSLAKILRRKK